LITKLCDCTFCKTGRAIDMAHSLMLSDPQTFKQGYTPENAAIAAAEIYGVDREAIRQHLEAAQ